MFIELIKWFGTKILLKKISNLSDLDHVLTYVQSEFETSEDAGRKSFNTFYYTLPSRSIPKDPYSAEYRAYQLDLYSHLSGKHEYSIANESVGFNLAEAKEKPFPYSTNSATTIGDQLLAIGFIIKSLQLPPGSRIVEFGPGWGNLTLQLVQCGYDVTCVETEEKFIDLLKIRTEPWDAQTRYYHMDMLEYVESCTERFDAVIFYESFHHCSDPLRMIKKLSTILADRGKICFAAEPIIPGPSVILPYPWGIRLDGMSVWSIRKWGWLELGFNETFFTRYIQKCGLTIEKYQSKVNPLTTIYVASKEKKSLWNKIRNLFNLYYALFSSTWGKTKLLDGKNS